MAGDFSKDSEFSGTKAVEDRRRFDEIQLDAWMRQHVEGYGGPLTVRQFKGGQSNPTYRLDTPGRSYVMRRKPFGKLLPSAHAVDREFRVISALGKQGFPVAQAYALGIVISECIRRADSLDDRDLLTAARQLNTTTLYGRFRLDPGSLGQVGHEIILVE